MACADVLKPWVNGMDLVRRPTGKWTVDFGWTMSVSDAALYEEPFRWVRENVYPMRSASRRKAHRERWWRHADPRPGIWRALDGISRCIATPTLAKHRLFVWCDVRICPDHQLVVIARDDDTTFGILHSRFHEFWSFRLRTSLEDRPRNTPSTTFETFPFPGRPDAERAGPELRGRLASHRDYRDRPAGSSSCGTGGSTRRTGSNGWTSRYPNIHGGGSPQ